jgi:hypothetical protein
LSCLALALSPSWEKFGIFGANLRHSNQIVGGVQ